MTPSLERLNELVRQAEARSRVMLVLQRASVTLAWILGIALALVVFDFMLRLPSGFRLVLLIAGVAALGYTAWGYLRSALFFHWRVIPSSPNRRQRSEV